MDLEKVLRLHGEFDIKGGFYHHPYQPIITNQCDFYEPGRLV